MPPTKPIAISSQAADADILIYEITEYVMKWAEEPDSSIPTVRHVIHRLEQTISDWPVLYPMRSTGDSSPYRRRLCLSIRCCDRKTQRGMGAKWRPGRGHRSNRHCLCQSTVACHRQSPCNRRRRSRRRSLGRRASRAGSHRDRNGLKRP